MLFWKDDVASLVVPPDPLRRKLVRDLLRRLACKALAKLPPFDIKRLPVVFCFLFAFTLDVGAEALLEEPRETDDWLLLRDRPFCSS